jgi:hypothetical protein
MHARIAAERLRVEAIENRWTNEGRVELPKYFAEFGVTNARKEIAKLDAAALADAQRQQLRPPTDLERSALDVLREVLSLVSPKVAAIVAGTTQYTVSESEVLLGQMKDARAYRSREVFLNEVVFLSEFGTALAVYLHEHAHIFGYDGSRGFSDALTEMIEQTVILRTLLDEPEERWRRLGRLITEERERASRPPSEVNRWWVGMNIQELELLIEALPPVLRTRLKPKAD